jgi:hypothetical protein
MSNIEKAEDISVEPKIIVTVENTDSLNEQLEQATGQELDKKQKLEQERNLERELENKKEEELLEVVETEDISDMETPIPEDGELTTILEKLKNMSPDNRNQLLAGLASNNNINPNNNQFSYASEQEMRKETIRRRINQMQAGRTSKTTLGFIQKKQQNNHAKRLEQLKKLQGGVDVNTDSENTEEVPNEAVVDEVPVKVDVVDTSIDDPLHPV